MLSLVSLIILAGTPARACSPHRGDEAEILRGSPGAPAQSAPWDHRAPPAYLDRLTQRFALSADELARLHRDGLVVPERLRFDSYAWAFHELYQSQVPLYVSADAVLHAVYATNDEALASLERARLAPLAVTTLEKLHHALGVEAKRYPAEAVYDLDVYLTVAQRLLYVAGAMPLSEAASREADALVKQAEAASSMATVTLFGRSRIIDFTQFSPRGHYANDEQLTAWFRAAMWLGRLEFNLVSRSCRSSHAGDVADPSETPREAVDALVLADLATRSGAMKDVDTFDDAWTTFAGRREDVSLHALADLAKSAHLTDLTAPGTAERLRAAIGDRFRRTTRIHFMPEGTTELPAISTFLGPRIVADTSALMPVLEPLTPGRHVVGAGDVAYALGHDRALSLLTEDLSQYPTLRTQLDVSRAVVTKAPAGPDLYGAWLAAVRGLSVTPPGARPSFTTTAAFGDQRVGSALAAFAQLRHNAVLLAGQGYDQGGCELPDGYVDPALAVYDALAVYAERGGQALQRLDPKDESHVRAPFARLAVVAKVLRAISVDELAGRKLSPTQLRWLNDILEMTPGSTGAAPTYTGWYFSLFPGPDLALKDASLIADYATSGDAQQISYVGVRGVQLGLFVVDTGGAPRVMVGPVTRAFEHHGPLANRLNDEAGRALPPQDLSAPWSHSFAVVGPAEPRLQLTFSPADEPYDEPGRPKAPPTPRVEEVRLKGVNPPVPVTVELLDHHRVPFASLTQPVGAGETVFRFSFPASARGPGVEMVHVQVGAWHDWVAGSWAGAYGTWGGFQEE